MEGGRTMRCFVALFATLSVAGCSGPSGATDAGVDAAADAGADAGPLPGAVFDTAATWHAPALACPDGVARREGRSLGAQRRFALSVLHYNIQYVAGGMDNFRLLGREPYDGWDDDRIQDAIVVESLVPVLDMLDRHPTWTLSLEMQGYMVEVMLARHRDVAQHLADLVRGGQVELVSFHYSDQLFLAYPTRHMEVSRAINTEVLAAGCVAASTPVFTQEGQFGEGIAEFSGAGNAIVLIPKNLFRMWQGDGPVAPYYERRGNPVVVAGRGVTDTASGFEVQWVYMDDAELLATNRTNPYFPETFLHDPAVVAAFEAELEALETDGWAIAGIADYVATLDAARVATTPLPAVLDGTWQPDDTGNVSRWMGDRGGFGETERDNGVLTRNSQAGRIVLAAEVALEAARAAGSAPTDGDERVQRAWRDLLLGEVSDATGWNPISNEIEYSFWHSDAATSRALELARDAAAGLGVTPPFVVDTRDGTVQSDVTLPTTEPATDPPITVDTSASMRAVDIVWERVVGEADHYVVTITSAAGAGAAVASFPWELSVVRYTPALIEGSTVDVPLAELAFTQAEGIAIGAGPFGLRDQVWLIPDAASVNLAARLDRAARLATFRDSTVPEDSSARWQFHVVTGASDRALEVADRLNLHPLVVIEAP